MKHIFKGVGFILMGILIASCEKDSIKLSNINDVALQVSFGNQKSAVTQKSAGELTYETPENYYVALKSATLKGADGTADVELFYSDSLINSLVFDFTDEQTTHSLLDGIEIPDGEYEGIEIEIYYLQMNIAIHTQDRGTERRNFRIYLSDDAEAEGGLHQPGDITQVNDNIEIGWLMGEGQIPNMDPTSPREAAYTEAGDGTSWYSFAGKYGADFGPFGDIEFWNNSPQPVYKTVVDMNFNDGTGTRLILDFNVHNCWMFEDKSNDGVFGADDLESDDPTMWNMQLPLMTMSLE